MRKRTLRAAILSPLVAVPVFVVWFVIFYFFFKGPEDVVDSFVWLFILLLYVLAIAYIATFLIGIPVDWLLRRIGLQSSATYALVGVVLGGAIGVTLFELSRLSAVIATCGLAISVVFGKISNAPDEPTI